jgi:HD superfamily phosphohydrolase
MMILEEMNRQFNGELQMAIEIFKDEYPKKFLHQLISGQLDVDRMDYLSRDSFFTGVSEGVIGYDRIIKMLTVQNGNLMIEEKGIYSIEKFLVSRRLMYWQVYLHKTVLGAEMLLVQIIRRAKELIRNGFEVRSTSIPFDFFLQQEQAPDMRLHLDKFCMLDDNDVMATIKNWVFHPDKVLSSLCNLLFERKLFKVRLQAIPFETTYIKDLQTRAAHELGISFEEAGYFVFTGEAQNTTYDPSEERIDIYFKDGTVKDISDVDNALIHQTIATPVKKFYICHLRMNG